MVVRFNLTKLDIPSSTFYYRAIMLNASVIKAEMAKRGLTQSALAELCDVSREAVSNWLAGESIPRPAKLKLLGQQLDLAIEQLLTPSVIPEPVVAFRTRERKPVTGAAEDAGVEVGRHFRQLLAHTGVKALFAPRHLISPSIDDNFIREAARAKRNEIGLSATDVLTNDHLLNQLHDFGAFLVPVFWGGDCEGHENALSIYLADSASSWVVFNLGCREDDFKYWLAHELGHCLTLHALQGDAGEAFAEKFAQYLLFPDELAMECLARMRNATDRLAVATWYAGHCGISVVTVVRAVQRVAEVSGEVFEKLDTTKFFEQWKASRAQVPTIATQYFGSVRPTTMEYVVRAEEIFRTPIFKALTAFQRQEGGRSPAFIAAALNVALPEAIELSRALWERDHCAVGGTSLNSAP
jgi:transcriptional regulator with XRE-family HTH domain